MLLIFTFLSVYMCVLFYYNSDPMKGSFFLVLSLAFIVPVVSYGGHVWYSYFICLVFLSGVFVILVYFSSLSTFMFMGSSFVLYLLMVCFFVGWSGEFMFCDSGLSEFYEDFFFFMVYFIIIVLTSFLGFASYYMGVSVAMRKM
uniref:NADH dehydrogenase subunit 6 n=1 Tax=Enterobius vermicularis TaxID=51028 RepID=B6CM40_ENTVE|nr:NADH dehydrogenase subunit 6 [Enterobius vermicularis]